MGPTTGDDGLARCPWGDAAGPMRTYHDLEWGVRLAGESAWFERLTLEAFQSGLSWATILAKRPAFRDAFAGFDVDAVAAFDAGDVERLMADAAIVRNRRKIEATLANARAAVALREDGDDALERLVLAHAPDVPPSPRTTEEQQTTSPESLALSKALKTRGFTFVGPTTMFALMEASGVFDPHLVGCHARGAISRVPR
ncbi:DNA-3-methyladenine glycosylase I [Nocardioides acrostichi]|uniref:DNA-3-methyladenine glycosylase I n=1 Tax=Nocardioides acrostichi TaxID=2784339 RepID=A0A930Y7W8_9ACTN|nr:DNA-3-methyladenine glycosylase I [Nocardioides acrostichi]MBF4162487.1 DNA-3-methyladenine glycosylase I [Nocardioides acrostichi]